MDKLRKEFEDDHAEGQLKAAAFVELVFMLGVVGSAIGIVILLIKLGVMLWMN